MNFYKIEIMSQLDPKIVRLSYYCSTGKRYRVARSVNHDHWLAYFVPDDEASASLVGPPVKTKKEAIALCEEHEADLPW